MRTGRLVSNAYCEVLSFHHSLVICASRKSIFATKESYISNQS